MRLKEVTHLGEMSLETAAFEKLRNHATACSDSSLPLITFRLLFRLSSLLPRLGLVMAFTIPAHASTTLGRCKVETLARGG